MRKNNWVVGPKDCLNYYGSSKHGFSPTILFTSTFSKTSFPNFHGLLPATKTWEIYTIYNDNNDQNNNKNYEETFPYMMDEHNSTSSSTNTHNMHSMEGERHNCLIFQNLKIVLNDCKASRDKKPCMCVGFR